MRLLQISNLVNIGSVGRIAEHIGQTAIKNGWESYIAYARDQLSSDSKLIKIGAKYDIYWHGLCTRLFDSHGLKSAKPTKQLIRSIEQIQPNIIHLHYIHGYYLNMNILINYLSEISTPIIWTFHDCWSFTGHCAYYDYANCNKWKTGCYKCPQTKEYPKSYFFDRSFKNYTEKKELFSNIKNLTIVPVSNWLNTQVMDSFLKQHPTHVIQNGIDLHTFSPQQDVSPIVEKYNLNNKFIILGVANKWERRKGFDDFIKLHNHLDEKYQMILVGLNKSQQKRIPSNIIGIEKTKNVSELASLYSSADVFVNPTWEDTYPTTNLEALACGTPVITYKTGGSVESVSSETGFIVQQGDIIDLKNKIDIIKQKGKEFYFSNCRTRAEALFNKENCFQKYMDLYNRLITTKERKNE